MEEEDPDKLTDLIVNLVDSRLPRAYGFSVGDWFSWNGFNGPDNRQAFQPNRSRRLTLYWQPHKMDLGS